MVGQVFTERVNIDDVIRWEAYEGYCRVAATIHNRTGSAVAAADVMGMPVQADSSVAGDYMFCQATAEASCTGLLLHKGSFAVTNLANLGTFKSKILVRGPAVVDQNFIKTADVLGVNYTMATLYTALKALNPPLILNSEHVTTTTLTT